MKQQSSALENLERAFKEFKDEPFPPTGPSKEIRDVHAVLILYDADVAAAVSKLLSSSKPAGVASLTGLRDDPRLEEMINNLVRTYPTDHAIGRTARQYASYDVIKSVLHEVDAYLHSQSQ